MSCLLLGEVIFDCFGDKKVIGGAPFNVAWNLTGFGCDILYCGAVGRDAEGDEALEVMQNWGISTKAVARVEKPTGRVTVVFEQNEPVYDINSDQAYDYIPVPDLEDSSPKLLYHGTLALRGETLHTLRSIKEKLGVSVFCDLNLREPWFTKELIESVVRNAKYLKVNKEEISHFTQNLSDIQTALSEVRTAYGIEVIFLTCGAEGAYLSCEECFIFKEAGESRAFVDSVGAGDGFSAVCIYGILNAWPYEKILEKAIEFAGRVCGIQGATSRDLSFYSL